MPLVRCPDCGREISNAAPACPQCGRPRNPEHFVQPVELTGKRWKGYQLVGGLMLVVGVPLALVAATQRETHDTDWILFAVLAVGLTLWLGGRLGAWWHHR